MSACLSLVARLPRSRWFKKRVIMPLPTERYTFVLTRLRYLDAAVANISTYRPDGKTPEQITALIPAADTEFADLVGKYNARNTADGTLSTAYEAGHDKAVSVYACMKSCYRSDTNCTRSIVSLPKEDRTPEQTLVRMKAVANLWVNLPSVPGTTGPLTVGGTTAAAFANMAADLEVKIAAATLADAQYSGQLAEFHSKFDDWDSFVSAAAVQGRAVYPPGSPERAYIDRIPTEPSTQLPVQAVITSATNPSPGAVFLEFTAEHATSFQVWHKGPGEPVFVKVADVLLPGEYLAAGLEPGAHEYQIVGENSRGDGPASSPTTVNVAESAVA